jgi:hypothetical protein
LQALWAAVLVLLKNSLPERSFCLLLLRPGFFVSFASSFAAFSASFTFCFSSAISFFAASFPSLDCFGLFDLDLD